MKLKMLVIITLFVISSTMGFAQSRPAASARVAAGETLQQSAQSPSPAIPSDCSPCLWYSGDVSLSGAYADGLWNESGSYTAQVWVPLIPSSDGNPSHKHVNISKITFLEMTLPYPPSDLNGGTYGFRTGVSEGNGGRLGRHGACETLTATDTGVNTHGYEIYAYTCTPNKAVKLPIGRVTWVNILPEFNGGTAAYLGDIEVVPSFKNYGWSNVFYNSFFDGDGYTFDNTQSSNVDGGCLGYGCDAFSVAISGTYVP
ncbi:MAG: hypothetical protein WA609_17100 [Terriglobales bacterium]